MKGNRHVNAKANLKPRVTYYKPNGTAFQDCKQKSEYRLETNNEGTYRERDGSQLHRVGKRCERNEADNPFKDVLRAKAPLGNGLTWIPAAAALWIDFQRGKPAQGVNALQKRRHYRHLELRGGSDVWTRVGLQASHASPRTLDLRGHAYNDGVARPRVCTGSVDYHEDAYVASTSAASGASGAAGHMGGLMRIQRATRWGATQIFLTRTSGRHIATDWRGGGRKQSGCDERLTSHHFELPASFFCLPLRARPAPLLVLDVLSKISSLRHSLSDNVTPSTSALIYPLAVPATPTPTITTSASESQLILVLSAFQLQPDQWCT
ncbi:hypothetical protein B0H13DRAFT_1887755 [Mycena leptocephala]|nr:hypothetical protein B0H13DRAFT_1887755 [Mycena leptocephala]